MFNYEAPFAKVIEFETVDIVTVSVPVADTPDMLDTWGGNVGNIDSVKNSIFG